MGLGGDLYPRAFASNWLGSTPAAVNADLGGPRVRIRKTQASLVALAVALTISPLAFVGTAVSAATNRTVTFAEQPGNGPNYIFPLLSGAFFDSVNQQEFQYLMYRPLYWFGNKGKPVFNPTLSLAQAPIYSDGDTVVTVHIKDYRWSDGTPVTARDVVFWMNLIKVEKANFGPYVPGTFPDNVASYRMTSGNTLQFTLTQAVSPTWFTYNELSQVTPLPLDWDRTSATSGVGNFDETPAGAAAVYSFLISQAKEATTYATNPLWAVVDGPWRLAQYSATTNYAAFVPNLHYSGSRKGNVTRFVEVPFTSDAAEFNALRSGAVDYGYVPTQDSSQLSYLHTKGFRTDPWTGWAFTYIDLDYLNPTAGPILDQQYVREALQSMVDQPSIIKNLYHGDAVTTNGPVPLAPSNPFVSSLERKGLYSYDPPRAISLLKEHGWHVVPNGVSTCTDAGTGAGQCGGGIPKGASLVFRFDYASGTLALQQESEVLRSDFLKAGVTLTLSSTPLNQLLANTTACAGSQTISSTCTWQINYLVSPRFLYEPDFYPSGEDIYATGAADSGDGYSNPAVDTSVKQTESAGAGIAALKRYENLIVKLVPTLFMPTPPVQVSAIRKSLLGTLPQDPMLNLNPEQWRVTR
jgi:peptide/nickel transport system substrate-binding protein